MENRTTHLHRDGSIENRSINPTSKNDIFNGTKDARVSFFNSVICKSPTEVCISEILILIQSENLRPTIENIRSQTTKAAKDALKRQLPCVTVSGSFWGGHAAKNLQRHSGFLQVDIDGLSNPSTVKARIIEDPFIYSCFVSPSGNGLKCIVKISSDNHQAGFKFAQDYFKNELKLTIDAKCKDVGRLMYLTHDANIYINEKTLIMNETTISIQKIITEIQQRQIDITSKYEDWLKIGFAFADEFGEYGRKLFHEVSRTNGEYNEEKCNTQYDNCLKNKSGKVTIASFFHLVKQFLPSSDIKVNPNSSSVNQSLPPSENNKVSRFFAVERHLKDHFDLRYNILAGDVEIKKKDEVAFIPINENSLYRYLQLNNIQFTPANLSSLLGSDFVPEYDPIIDYFKILPEWDGTDHIDHLTTFLEVSGQERFNRHFKKMLVRSVACGMGQKWNKQAFILMGGQSSGKTTFWRWLCPPKLQKFYTEHITTDKDGLIALTNNYLINLDELAALQKYEINALKSMVSRDFAKVRPPFGKRSVVLKRRANFVGSTNKDEFLNDETGNVRWLCFIVNKIDWEYKDKVNLEQVWAQALHLHNAGFSSELDTHDILENENANAEYIVRSPELELVQGHFVPAEKDDTGAEALTATDIFMRLKISGIAPNNLNTSNIGKAMKQLKFKQTSQRISGSPFPKKVYWVKLLQPLTTVTTSIQPNLYQ
jgi:hypothetical protein